MIDALECEIKWCEENRGTSPVRPPAYEDGFIDGLKQAIIILGLFAKCDFCQNDLFEGHYSMVCHKHDLVLEEDYKR